MRMYVDIVDRWPDQRPSFCGVCDHVSRLSRDCNGEQFVGADCGADGGQHLREGIDLVDLVRVGGLLVVCSIATRVLPVDIWRMSVMNTLRSIEIV